MLDQITEAVAYLDRLSARGREIAARLQTTADSAVDIRAWQQEVAVAVNELSGGSKQHWLSRAFSQAFLVTASSASSASSASRASSGEVVTEVSPADIVERLLAVLAQARASLATMEPFDIASRASIATPAAPAVRRFDFVHNAELRPVLEQAYADSARAAESGDFHRAFLTGCSILEAIITDGLEHRVDSNQKVRLEPDTTNEQRVQDLSFDQRIAAAEAAGLIRGGCARLPSTARTYRDLEPNIAVSERDAKVVRQVLNVVIRDLDPGR